jgi:hypothetical protein
MNALQKETILTGKTNIYIFTVICDFSHNFHQAI